MTWRTPEECEDYISRFSQGDTFKEKSPEFQSVAIALLKEGFDRVQLIIAKTSNSKLIIKISTAKRKNRRNILNIPLSPRYFDSGSYLFNY